MERQLSRPGYAKPVSENVPETRPSAYIAPVQEKTSLPRWMRRLDNRDLALLIRQRRDPSRGLTDPWLLNRLEVRQTGRKNIERVGRGLPLWPEVPNANLVHHFGFERSPSKGDLVNRVRQVARADSQNLVRQLRQAEPEIPVDLSDIVFNRPPKLAHVTSLRRGEPLGLRSKHSVNQGMLPWIAMAQESQMTNLRRFGKLGLGLTALGALGVGGKMAWDHYNAPGKYHQGQAPNGSFVPSAAGWDTEAWGPSDQAYTPQESNQIRQQHAATLKAERLARPSGPGVANYFDAAERRPSGPGVANYRRELPGLSLSGLGALTYR